MYVPAGAGVLLMGQRWLLQQEVILEEVWAGRRNIMKALWCSCSEHYRRCRYYCTDVDVASEVHTVARWLEKDYYT